MNERFPWLKGALEWGPLILFLVVFMLLRDRTVVLWGNQYSGFIVATLLFIPVLVASTLALWRLTGHLSAMQIVTLVLVLVFGGLSVWLNDPRFFKMKPTIVYLLFAGLLGYSLMAGKNWLGAVMSAGLKMQPEGWRILTQRMVGAFVGMAVLNEIVWRTMSETTWVWFKTFGLTAILFVFIMANASLFSRYALKDDQPGGGA
ncbi:MAG: inner membrane-spanning protein YciB [Paracoccus sp. (in: a-proteobacteria)]|uniref:inner membrane-spanning protein YciB n=1 Tax=Paracoccus sp. TaxID=267 RepID=UPI0026DF358D|nr:inner membrane-spanning protein YciB [Paracoccus sp. (in: a-proteobacteria)]MDO5630775.1 inner membrane-spanning protein YciB [Paracoccus sp. (in: a-proteobacteria)]